MMDYNSGGQRDKATRAQVIPSLRDVNKLALADTFIYKGVAIYDYLKRLKSDGQDTSAYRTIGYYY